MSPARVAAANDRGPFYISSCAGLSPTGCPGMAGQDVVSGPADHRPGTVEVANSISHARASYDKYKLPTWAIGYLAALATIAAVCLLVLLPLTLKTRAFKSHMSLRIITRMLLCVLVQSAVMISVTGYLFRQVQLHQIQ